VRPDVEPVSAACVSSWVTTRPRPSASSDENGGQTTTSRSETTRVVRSAGPSWMTLASERAASVSTPRIAVVSARACSAPPATTTR
jgi:hypothetical protein